MAKKIDIAIHVSCTHERNELDEVVANLRNLVKRKFPDALDSTICEVIQDEVKESFHEQNFTNG